MLLGYLQTARKVQPTTFLLWECTTTAPPLHHHASLQIWYEQYSIEDVPLVAMAFRQQCSMSLVFFNNGVRKRENKKTTIRYSKTKRKWLNFWRSFVHWEFLGTSQTSEGVTVSTLHGLWPIPNQSIANSLALTICSLNCQITFNGPDQVTSSKNTNVVLCNPGT